MGIKVKLLKKSITKGRQSLYLDFYPPIQNPETGHFTRREFLGYYILENPKNELDKQHKKETLLLAEKIRQRRENDVNKPEIYSEYEKERLKKHEKGEQSFLDYFKKLADKRVDSNHDNWESVNKYLIAFSQGSLKFAEIDIVFCNEFKEYLLTTKSNKSSKVRLSQNSAVSYFNKFKAALKQAFKDGYLSSDINSAVEPIKQAETRRNFLTIEELNALIKTECLNPLLKRAALFSALTGLRFSDIQNLIWGNVEFIQGEGYFIHFDQKKTKGVEVLPISEQAYGLLGERRENENKVFQGLKYSAFENKYLYQWIGAAGITKDVTFHSFRHTYATLQLSKGTDIYTVSKMLGHKDLKTTQIYAKVMDEAKREASRKIILEF